jgi:hypothetical protein
MMDYTIFKELVSDKFMEYMPEEFRNGKLTISRVNKINGTKDGLSIYQEGAQAAPTIYVDDMYENFKRNDNLEEVFEEAAELYVRAAKEMPPIPISSVTEGAQDKIYMVLVNTESNKELLNNAPHREVNDTSVIYRIMIRDDERGLASTLITNDIAKEMGMSEEELFKIAAGNTPKLFPPVVRSMSQVLAGLLSKDGGMPGEVADQVVEGLQGGDELMWIISNDKGVSGAVNMIFENNLRGLSKKLGDDLYILPSSIHEVIAISAGKANLEDLARMVQQVNTEVVDVSERLSNQVYYYDREARKLSMATDTPNKGITNEVAEVGLVYDTEQKR